MRALRNLGIFLGVLIVVAVVADVGTRYLVENRIESTIEGADTVVDVGNVDAHVDSFPFLGRLATQGRINHFSLRLEDLAYDGGRFDALELNVDGVVFERSRLFNAQVEVQSLERATISAEITEATATEAVGVPVTLTPGTATVVVGGQSRSAAVAVGDGVLTLSTDGLGVLTIPIAENDYFPCAVDARVEQGRFVLSCTATELPPALRQVVGGGGIN